MTYAIHDAAGCVLAHVPRPIEDALPRLRECAIERVAKVFLYRSSDGAKLAVAAPGRVGVTMRDVDGRGFVGRRAGT